jgi:hypothetical protein
MKLLRHIITIVCLVATFIANAGEQRLVDLVRTSLASFEGQVMFHDLRSQP